MKKIISILFCVVMMLSVFAVTAFAADGANSFSLPIPSGRGPEAIPSERLQPRLVDAADIIPDEKEAEIIAHLDKLSEKDGFDYVVATTASCGTYSVRDVADDYYDYNGFGQGEERDGCLLLISMDPRKIWVSTCGKGMSIITDSEIDPLIDKFYDEVKSGDYAAACTKFANAAHTEHLKYQVRPVGLAVICVLFGVLVGNISINTMKKSYNTIHAQDSAKDYVVNNSLKIVQSRDTFRYRNVTKTAIPKNTSSSGGGSHTSSSGSSHGGGGRSF